ncbi:hypothetical protein Tco_0276550 [Tanacetum coccineum]
MEHKGLFNDGADLLRNVTTRRKKMTGKGDAGVSQPRMPGFAADSSNQSSFETSTKAAAIDDRNASTLMSVSTSNVPIHNIDVVADLFGVPLKSCKDIDEFTKDFEADKYELWSVLTKEKRGKITDIICNRWDALLKESESMPKGAPIADDYLSSKVSPNDPIVQSVIINEKPTSYIGASGGSKPEPSKSKANLCPLFSENLCEGAKISIPRKVFSEDGLSIIASQIGKPIMLDSYTTSMCIDSWGRSSFARCLIEINAEDALSESLTIGVPLIEGSGYTIETVSSPPTVVTSNVVTSTVEKTNDGFQTVGKKKKKGKSKSTTGGQFVGPLVKQNVRYEPKATKSAPIKGATNVGNASKSSSMLKTTGTSSKKGNITTSNSYSALDDESDEDVENVYDESANLIPSTKTGDISIFFMGC